jgi:hypothetical protein
MSAGSANLELDDVDALRPVLSLPNGLVFLATFNFYGHTKSGDYLAKQAFYTVLQLRLARQLPHILFDSRYAKRRQFKMLYLRTQQFSVQGGFDDVFDTYAPESYALDTLSFVTPEVMEKLLEAKDYDIEIQDDSLLLYAPLLSDQEIATLVQRGQAIAKELDDNIDTYRDDRLNGEQRKHSVTAFSRTLLRNPWKNLYIAFALTVAAAGLLVVALRADPRSRPSILFNTYAIIGYAFVLDNYWRAFKIWRENRKILRWADLSRNQPQRPVSR